MSALSRNSFVTNGLVDGQGRDAYLLPFLRDFRPSLPGEVVPSLTLYDFAGEPMVQVRRDPAVAQDRYASLVSQALNSGRAQVLLTTYQGDTSLKLVQPIHFPPTRSVEGALALQFQLAPLLAEAAKAAFIKGRYWSPPWHG